MRTVQSWKYGRANKVRGALQEISLVFSKVRGDLKIQKALNKNITNQLKTINNQETRKK